MKRRFALLAISGPLFGVGGIGGASMGCAKAVGENAIIGGIDDDAGVVDAREFPRPDASPVDAPPNQVAMSQNTSDTIVDGNSFACVGVTSKTARASTYYRVFQPANYGVRDALHVTQVSFGVELAAAGTGALSQAATVKIATYVGATNGVTLDGTINVLASAAVQIPNGEGFTMSAPITADVRAGDQVMAMLEIPDGGGKRKFLIGSNAAGERGKGYVMSTDCAWDAPTTMSSIAFDNDFGEVDILMSVTGTY